MKRYSDYMQMYELVKDTGINEGHNLIVKPNIFVGIHFLEDNGITEPWRPDAAEKLHRALQDYPKEERERFLTALNELFDTFKK